MDMMPLSIEGFGQSLLRVDRVLKAQKKEFLKQEEQVFALIDEAAKTFQNSGHEQQSEGVRRVAEELVQEWSENLRHWKDEQQQRSTVREELEKYGSGLIIAVFGRTNAGKSTLGNFMRGKMLKEAPFDNLWKDGTLTPSPIEVVERGTNSQVKSGAMEFSEGYTETTCEIQLFTMPGLTWVDTPGFSSNTAGLGSLARKYVNRADLVVYLDQAENPGLSSNAHELCKLLSNGRLTLLVINKSDENVKVKLPTGYKMVNGKVVRARVPKNPEVRKGHEDQLRQSLLDLGFQGQCEAMSMSLLLANRAIQGQDNEMLSIEEEYTGSNMDFFFKKIMSLIPDDRHIQDLKSREGRLNLISLIDNIVGRTEQDEPSLKHLLASLDGHLAGLKKQLEAFSSENEADRITKILELELHRLVSSAAKTAAQSGLGVVSRDAIADIVRTLRARARDLLAEKTRSILKDLWQANSAAVDLTFTHEEAALRKETSQHKYSVPVAKSRRRDPDGFWETVKSWFGSEYYETYMDTEVRSYTIDLGWNTQDVIRDLTGKLQAAIAMSIHATMEKIQRDCLEAPIGRFQTLQDKLEALKGRLEEMRSGLQRETGK